MTPSEQFNALVAAVPENADADWTTVARWEDKLRIYIPWSGGLDSTTLAVRAIQEGLPVTLVSFMAGQEWDAGERRARHFIEQRIPELQDSLKIEAKLPEADAVFKHIHVGRNVKMIEWLAARTAQFDQVTEIWLAWLEGETLQAAGDKSHVVLSWLQHKWPTVNLQLPFRFSVKSDLIRWWANEGRLDDAAHLYSCFTGDTMPCGHCQACFRTYVGWAAAGFEESLPWIHRLNISPDTVAKYRSKKYTSSRRQHDTLKALARYEIRLRKAH